METNFNFKSQICTTREQSERLVAMGLKPETADMMWDAITVIRGKPVQEPMWSLRPYYYPKKSSVLYDNEEQVFIPAWSLHRLLELMPEEMYGGLLCIFKDSIRYEEMIMDRLEAHFDVVGDNMYENAISCIEWLIKEGYFNKEYLE